MALRRLESLVLANSGSPTVARALAELGTPSTSIAVLESGSVSAACHSTLDDDAATVFQACSISKPITALAIMRLVDDGHFTLDSTISQLLPTDVLSILVEDSPDSQRELIEQITVRQLMSHTSGLSVHGFAGYSSLDTDLSGADIIRGRPPVNNLRVRLELLPGLTYSYSGGGITVLQILLESITKKPFPELMQHIVLKPLKMDRSFYGPLPDHEKNAACAHLTGHVRADTPHHIQPELAAAGLWTTPSDLLKAVQAVQQSLSGGGFLKQSTAKEMLTKVKRAMGLSWAVSLHNTDFSHMGANEPGYRCMVAGFADLGVQSAPKDCGFAIMTNSAEGMTMLGKIRQAICYLNEWPLAGVTGSNIQDTPFWDDKALVGGFWKNYVGEWQYDGSIYKIVDNDGSPVMYHRGYGPIRMLPAATPGAQKEDGDTVFFVLEGLKLVLKFGQHSERSIITLENGEQRESYELERVQDQ